MLACVFQLFRKKTPEPAPEEATFKQCVEAFWAWYASVADRFYQEIEARRCAGLADEVSENVDKHLAHFAWVFGPGAAGKGHSFTLTAEANRHRQFLTQYWQGRAPKLPGWTFYPARQPGELGSIVLDGSQLRFDPIEIWLTPFLDDQDEEIDLTVWHPLFARMTEKQRWMVVFLFLDEALGEYGTQERIGELKLNNERLAQAIPLAELAGFVAQTENAKGWKRYIPGECGSTYRINDDESSYPRSDVFVGSSTNISLIREFIKANGQLPDPLAGTGADFIYVAFPATHLPKGEEVAVRGRIEDALGESLRSAASGRLIGGAMGRRNAYIDLLVFDGNKSLELVREVLLRERLPRGTTINFFAKEKAQRVVTLPA
jgi:hypothetical protein